MCDLAKPACAAVSDMPKLDEEPDRGARCSTCKNRRRGGPGLGGPRGRRRWTGWWTNFDLDGLTYYYRGLDGNEYERLGAGLILGNSLLTARGIPASGEGDLKTCLAMMIMDRFGAGGSFTEFYAMDFSEQLRADGARRPRHIAISDEKPSPARSGPVSRQARPRRFGRVQSEDRAGHGARDDADGRRRAEDVGAPKANRCPGPSSRSATRTRGCGSRSARRIRQPLVPGRPHAPLRPGCRPCAPCGREVM